MLSVSSEVVSSDSNLVGQALLCLLAVQKSERAGHEPKNQDVGSFYRVWQLHFWRA